MDTFIGFVWFFSVNICFGFDNGFSFRFLPRAQALIHLHAGSIGWVTLSLISLAIWIFTGEREVSDSYVSRVRALTCAAIGIFGAYIVSFDIAYSRGGIRAWTWFGSFWVVMFVLLFIFAAVSFAEDISASPPWLYIVFSHTAFVGMMTNLLLGVYALRRPTQNTLCHGENRSRCG